jgi:ligand-binding sensor domain-containing protein
MLYSTKNNSSFIFILFIGLFLNAQTNPISILNTSNGMPNNQIESIYKDSRDILWVGTHNGLAKIENNEIETFITDDGLSNNSIWDIIEDDKGNLWFATYGGGISKFDGQRFTSQNHIESLESCFVRKLFIHNNHLLIGTEKGLYIMNLSDNSITALETEQERFQVMGYFTNNGNIYVAAYLDGIFRLDYLNQKLIKVRGLDNLDTPSVYSINKLEETIYYGSNRNIGGKSMFKYLTSNLIEGKAPLDSYGNSIIWDVAKSKNENIFAAGWGVIYEDGGLFEILNDSLINVSNKYGIDSDQIRTLEYDSKYHFLHVGSQDKGVYKINLNKNLSFTNTKGKVIGFETLNHNLFTLRSEGLGIEYQNGNKKKINTSEFVNYLNSAVSELSQEKAAYIDFINNMAKGGGIIFRQIINRQGFIWVSTNIGLFKISASGVLKDIYHVYTNKFEFVIQNDIITAPLYESALLYTKIINNSTLLKNSDSIYNYNGFHHSKPNNPNYVTAMIRDGNKIYCSSSKKGLFVFENEEFKSFAFSKMFLPKDINHLSINIQKRELIASTISGDVYILDLDNQYKISRKISKKEIEGNNILTLDNYKNQVLLTTEKGLNIIDENNNLRLIDKEQGLQNLNFTSSKIIDETLYLGTSEGYYTYNLSNIETEFKHSHSVDITNIKVNHKIDTTLSSSWFKIERTNLTYSHKQNTIEIGFKVSDHPFPDKLSYSYQVLGLDSLWHNYNQESKLFLPYLPSGKFTINLKVRDLHLGKTSAHNLVNITIKPPFWKTWWFTSTFILFLGVLGYIVYTKRINHIKERERKQAITQKRLLETKMEALQSQMNPHFTFNAMNSIQNFIIDNDIDNALMYMGEFARLIRKTLDNSSQPFITLAEEISYLKSYISLENMRFNDKVNVDIIYINIETSDIEIPPMLIQPFIENAFVHAFNNKQKKPSLTITFTVENQLLICTVSDNGEGMTKSTSGQLHQSKGLKLVTERLNLLNESSNSSFEIKSEVGKGTEVILQFELIEF